MPQVERTVTRFSEVELARALILAYEEVFGSKPTLHTVVNAWSQSALECGRDGKGYISKCRNYNLGNITVTVSQARTRDYWALRCKEQLRDSKGNLTGKWKWFDMMFAANPTLLKGAVHYWVFFSSKKRISALHAMQSGGAAEFTRALAAIWYMTANPGHYLAGLKRLHSVANKSCLQAFEDLATETKVPTDPPLEPLPSDEPEVVKSTPSTVKEEVIKPLLLTVPLEPEESSRPSAMVPIFEIEKPAWERFLLWAIAVFLRVMRAVTLKGE